jgi:hypothetical protein
VAVNRKGAWECGWFRRDFRRIRKEPAFAHILALCRATNMLRFVQWDVDPGLANARPSADRASLNRFFLASSLLVEWEGLIRQLGPQFNSVEEYKRLAALIHGKPSQRILNRFRQLRNQAVFHFDIGFFNNAPDTSSTESPKNRLSSRGS